MRATLWFLLLVLLVPAMSHAEEDDGEDAPGVGRRLRAIDEAAEREADYPDAADEDPAGEEEPDPALTEHDDAPVEPAAPSRRDADEARAKAKAPSRGDAVLPTGRSPLDPAPDVDDER